MKAKFSNVQVFCIFDSYTIAIKKFETFLGKVTYGLRVYLLS